MSWLGEALRATAGAGCGQPKPEGQLAALPISHAILRPLSSLKFCRALDGLRAVGT